MEVSQCRGGDQTNQSEFNRKKAEFRVDHYHQTSPILYHVATVIFTPVLFDIMTYCTVYCHYMKGKENNQVGKVKGPHNENMFTMKMPQQYEVTADLHTAGRNPG